MDAALVDSVRKLLQSIVNSFGPDNSILLVLIACVFVFVWKWYNSYLKKTEINAALEEKERTIQRLTNEVRTWRTAVLKEKFKWSDEEVKNFLITENFSNPQECREYLLGIDTDERKGKKK